MAATKSWKVSLDDVDIQSLAAIAEYDNYGIIGKDNFDREVRDPVARIRRVKKVE